MRFHAYSMATDSHFGLGIVIDQYKAKIFSLNFHLGPLVVKLQWIMDAKWLLERSLKSQKREIEYRDKAIKRLRKWTAS